MDDGDDDKTKKMIMLRLSSSSFMFTGREVGILNDNHITTTMIERG
jgi:hypothetical protein